MCSAVRQRKTEGHSFQTLTNSEGGTQSRAGNQTGMNAACCVIT